MGSVPVTQPPAIVVAGLRKNYGRLCAVDGLSFQVRRGEIYAILGPNGAGKTTTVEILEGHRKRSSGLVQVLGFDPGTAGRQFRERIGIVLQSGGIDAELTVREAVALYASFYARPRDVPGTIEQVGLAGKGRARVRTLSGGQSRRLDLALALIGDPELLFLDEPTTGFDPSARREAWEIVRSLASLGKTVLLTTHFMDAAEYLADRVAVVAAGRVVAEGAPATLGFRDRAKVRVRYRLPAGVEPPPGLGGPPGPDGFTEALLDDAVADVHRLCGWAIEEGVDLDGFEVRRPSLEDVYLALTGSGALLPEGGEEAP